MISLDGKDDWIFVTEDTGTCDWVLKPQLYDDLHSALIASEKWIKPGKEENVKVVKFTG